MPAINGYILREAIKRHTLRRDTAAAQFKPSLKAFPGEEKTTPLDIAHTFVDAERAIAALQIAQSRYNLIVVCQVEGRNMPLGECIKRVGGAARIEKMWRSAASPSVDRYSVRDEDMRVKDNVYAAPTVTSSDAAARAESCAKIASALRQAIATGNLVEEDTDVLGLDPSLLE